MLFFEQTEITYTIEIPEDDFIALLDYEWNNNNYLSEKLRNVGCNYAEYDGHYPNYIYLGISIEDNTDEFKQELSAIIENHLKVTKENV